jgi:hypothetical protein
MKAREASVKKNVMNIWLHKRKGISSPAAPEDLISWS